MIVTPLWAGGQASRALQLHETAEAIFRLDLPPGYWSPGKLYREAARAASEALQAGVELHSYVIQLRVRSRAIRFSSPSWQNAFASATIGGSRNADTA
jgi:hypothetical protein